MSSQPLSLGYGIYAVDALYVRPQLAAAYLMVEQGQVAIIDTGTALAAPQVLEALTELGLGPEAVRYVIPTHAHLDHAGGAGALMQACPQATLVAHPRTAPHMIDPAKLIAGASAVYGSDGFAAMFGEIVPVPEARVQVAEDRTRLSLGGRELLLIDTPGHARHHLCVWDAASQGFFTGDTYGIAYPELNCPSGPYLFAPCTPVQFDPDAWHGTLERMVEFDPQRMYLTHFGLLAEPVPKAPALHRQIDAYVEIAHGAVQGETVDRAAIAEGLARFYWDELESAGFTGTHAEAMAALEMDLNLNAQGLEVWVKRVIS